MDHPLFRTERRIIWIIGSYRKPRIAKSTSLERKLYIIIICWLYLSLHFTLNGILNIASNKVADSSTQIRRWYEGYLNLNISRGFEKGPSSCLNCLLTLGTWSPRVTMLRYIQLLESKHGAGFRPWPGIGRRSVPPSGWTWRKTDRVFVWSGLHSWKMVPSSGVLFTSIQSNLLLCLRTIK